MRAVLLLLLSTVSLSAVPELWYRQPARTEEEAFPLGDGNSPVWKVFGDPKSERVERQDATVVIDWLDADQPATDYRRALNVQDGVATTSWKRGNSTITTTVLADPEDGVLLIHLQADMPGALGFRTRFLEPACQPTGVRGELELKGQHLRVLPFESEVHPDGNAMKVQGEGEAMIVVSYGAGSFPKLAKKYDGRDGDPDVTLVWSRALAAHVARQRARMGGFSIEMGEPEAVDKPTDERLRAPDALLSDPHLAAVMLQYACYRTGLCLPSDHVPDSSLLIKYDAGLLTLLPALPPAWKTGTTKAFPGPFIPIPGDYTVDMTWKNGQVTDYAVHRSAPNVPEKIRVKVNGRESEVLAK